MFNPTVKPYDWPSNIPWKKSYKIDYILESLPSIYVLTNGMRVKAVLSKEYLNELKKYRRSNKYVKRKSMKRKRSKNKRK